MFGRVVEPGGVPIEGRNLVVERRDLKETLRRLLAFFADQPATS